jgi:hypothetical protein
MRLAILFTVGFECAQVTGLTVACHKGGRLWTSDEPAPTDVQLNVQEALIGRGDQLAVVVAVADDPTVAVGQYLAAASLPVGRLATLSPAAPHRCVVPY